MINLIYGPKGSGKTKKIIDSANAYLTETKGNLVYVTDVAAHSKDIKAQIRFINISEYNVKCVQGFLGFLKGLIASNRDVTRIFVDGVGRILDIPLDQQGQLFDDINKISTQYNVNFVFTISCDKLPASLKKFA